MWHKNVGTSFFRFVTMHAFDRQTDRRTDRKAFAITCVVLRAVPRQKSDISWQTHHVTCVFPVNVLASYWTFLGRAMVLANNLNPPSPRA